MLYWLYNACMHVFLGSLLTSRGRRLRFPWLNMHHKRALFPNNVRLLPVCPPLGRLRQAEVESPQHASHDEPHLDVCLLRHQSDVLEVRWARIVLTKLRPMQFRGPTEKGCEANNMSFLNFCLSSADSGCQRSGMNSLGSVKLAGERLTDH